MLEGKDPPLSFVAASLVVYGLLTLFLLRMAVSMADTVMSIHNGSCIVKA